MTRIPQTEMPRWRERPIDLAVLTLLARYRFLRGTSVTGLLDAPRATVHYSLRKMFDQGLLEKTQNQRGKANNPYYSDIYQITKEGTRYILDKPTEVTNLAPVDVTEPVRYFEHTMMICDTLSSIEIGVKQSGLEFISQGDILSRMKDVTSLSLPYKVRYTFPSGRAETRTSHAVPDGMFGIRYPGNVTRLFLLETEHLSPCSRTTLKSSSTFRKVLAYQDIQKSGAIKQFGKSAFNVLLVFPTLDRMHNARDMVKDTFGSSDLFLFGQQDVQERTFESTKPNPGLVTEPWKRAGKSDISITQPH